MEKLINDPECITFMSKKQVSLPLLKNEIDRRILKITTMIRRKKVNNSLSDVPSFQNQYVQTENIVALHQVQKDSLQETKILCPSKKNHNVQQSRPYKLAIAGSPTKMRSSKNISNRKFMNLQRQPNNQVRCMTSQTQIQDQMMQSNFFNFHGNQSLHNSQMKTQPIQRYTQNDEIFQNIDFAAQIQSITHKNNRQKIVYNPDQSNDSLRNEETLISFHTEYSGSDRTKIDPFPKRKNTKAARIPSRDLTNSQPEARYIVSSDCLQRMKNEAEQLIQRRRKELFDSKVRQNMLKKIEERYGELDCS